MHAAFRVFARAGSLPVCLVILLRLSLVLPASAQNPADFMTSPVASRQPIREEMFISIGGIEQWITIKGDNGNNPVLLFLHGGPGDALSPFADALFKGWEKDFTLVQWDQRGAGRTYSKNSLASTMTIERMVQDGIAVAEYLTKHLNQKKIILEGESWGSILGISMAHARPDLFYAYVGVAQVVNWQEGLLASYTRVLDMARVAGDQEAVIALTALGPPPWHSVSKWPVYRKWQRIFQAKLVTAPPAPIKISADYASPQERAQYEEADDFSFLHFWGRDLNGPLTQVDLPSLGTHLAVPIFMIQGEEDLTASPELARCYFDAIIAPQKQFFLVAGTGHEPSESELTLTYKVLLQQVRPLATGK